MCAYVGGWALLAAGAVLGTGACRHQQYLDPRLFGQTPRTPEPTADVLQVRFMSVQGFVLRWRSVAVMTPPMYSNPSFGMVLAGNTPLTERPELVDRFMDPSWLKGVEAVLVGHSHYDHLMDLPYIVNHHFPTQAKDARVYGGRTAGYLLEAKGVPRSKIVVLNAAGDDVVDYRPCQQAPVAECPFVGGSPGKPVTLPSGLVRFRALCSKHSSQFAKLPVSSPGCLDALPSHPPQTANEWHLGDTFAYLVDFLDEKGQVAFRVYYQDSPTDPTFGQVPADVLAEHKVDVAILCAGAFDQVEDNPQAILANTTPRFVILGHWEHFFVPLTEQLQTLFAFDLNELRQRIESARGDPSGLGWKGRFWFPAPGALFVFDRAS